MIDHWNTPDPARMDASLRACGLILLESLFMLLSGILLFLLAGVRVLTALASLALAAVSFILWSFTAWSAGVQWLQVHLVDIYQFAKEEMR